MARRPAPPSFQSPACAFNQPSSPAFEPNLRLIGCCILRLRLGAFRWLAPPVDLPAVPSSRLPARAFRQPSSSAFEPACSLRRLLFRAPPSCRCPACAFHRPSGPPIAPVSGLRFQLRSPAPLSDPPAACAACFPSSPASRPNLRLSSNVLCLPVGLWSVSSLRLQPTLFAQPSGLIFDSRLRLCPQARLSISLATRAACSTSSPPSDVPPACAFVLSSGSAFLLTFQLAPSSQPLQPLAFELQLPTYCASSVERNIRSLAPVHASANRGNSVDIIFRCITCSAMLRYCESAGIQPCSCIQSLTNVGFTFSSGGDFSSSPMCVPCTPSSKICSSTGMPARFSTR